jgi:UDP-glucuronate 4-epimerase
MKILVTGAAGFIGFHLTQKLLSQEDEVVGLDNINDYYDVSLKESRLKLLKEKSNFSFYQLDLADQEGIEKLFQDHQFDIVVNLAAQAGVRYSLKNPRAYINSNIVGFTNILEGCRHSQVKHLVFASSSSVYGANIKIPFSVQDHVDHPISLYAASKKSNELMAHAYSHLYKLPTTGLRFFTVYGPWGRPDMAYFLFTQAILSGEPINIFNYGKMQRDFTYIDDIIEGLIKVMNKIPQPHANWSPKNPDPGTSKAPYKIYNLGNNNPVELLHFIEVIESCLGIKAKKNLLPMQPGDVPITYADVDDLIKDVGFKPDTPIEVGIKNFIDWYRNYYQL